MDGHVCYSEQVWEEVADFLKKKHNSLFGRHTLLWDTLFADENGNRLSKNDIDIILTDCAFGMHSMRQLLLDYAERLVTQEYEEDLIKWHKQKKRA